MSLLLNGTTGLTMNDGSTIVSGEQVARGWVNFNGTGVVAIRDSYNVSSITDNGTGDYTLNFTTALPNANYANAGMAGISGGVTIAEHTTVPTKSTTQLRVETRNTAGALADVGAANVIVFAGN